MSPYAARPVGRQGFSEFHRELPLDLATMPYFYLPVSPKPTVAVHGYKVVIHQVRVGGTDAFDLVELSRREALFRIQTQDSVEQPDRKSTRLNSSHANISY